MRPSLLIGRLAGNRRGFALVLVIWLLSLLSLVGLSFTGAMRTESQVAAHAIADSRERAVLEAGVHRGIAALLAPSGNTGWRLDGVPQAVRFDGKNLAVSLHDESGKVDLNAASPELLRRLLLAAGASLDDAGLLVDRILDWRDQDDQRRLNGAEAADYAAAGRAVGPDNRRFRLVAELRQVLGLLPELFERLRQAVTVHSGIADPVEAVAPELVLLALRDGDTAAVEATLQARQANPPRVGGGATPRLRVVTVRSQLVSVEEGRRALEATIWLPQGGDAAYRIVDWRWLPLTAEDSPPVS